LRPCADPPAAAEVCCWFVNFRTTRASAQHWASQHPGVTGRVRNRDVAVCLAIQAFGELLTATP